MDYGFIALFLLGLLGAGHCLGMCGGIVGALALQMAESSLGMRFMLQLAYSLGRVSTYGVLGALLGGLGAIASMLESVLPVQLVFYVVAQLLLIFMGLYLLGMPRFLAPLERAGQRLWVLVQPFIRKFLPVRSLAGAYAVGTLWGFLPCGLVYSALGVALMSGSSLRGAAAMLAFGLGTLPALVLAGLFAGKLRSLLQHPGVRLGAGLVVIAFGFWGLVQVSDLENSIWKGVVCHN